MSLFSTIAHDGPIPARALRPMGIWLMAAGLALAATVGLLIVNNPGAEPDPAAPTATRMSHDEFVRLNTTALDGLAPAAVIVESQKVMDPFVYINTTALDGLATAAVVESRKVVDPFTYINTTALEYSPAGYAEPSTGPR
ncbi:MAG: hypothetical protein LC739_13835 [Actinobacteria bacterium]|nr:hypothetical protein [Actinomycetota bacterium]